jgi:superoxide dismutase, Fe-Mn family
MGFKLIDLPYDKNSFGDALTAESFDYHYGKHLQAYVNNTNNLISGTEFENMPLLDIIQKSSGGLYNNSSQIFNHEFFFNELTPTKTEPDAFVIELLTKSFGSIEKFKEEFSQKATTLFGSGWCWLVKLADGTLAIEQYFNADTPVKYGKKPILTLDVWEHAYYIDYRNARPNFIAKFFELINWDFVSKQLN